MRGAARVAAANAVGEEAVHGDRGQENAQTTIPLHSRRAKSYRAEVYEDSGSTMTFVMDGLQ